MIIYSPHLSPQAGLVSPGAWTPDIIHIKNILVSPVGLDTHRQIKKHDFHLSEVWGRNPNWRINPKVDICLPKEFTLWCTKVKSKYWNINILKYQHIRISKYQNIKLMKANQCAGEAHGARSVYKLPTKSRGRSENHNYISIADW